MNWHFCFGFTGWTQDAVLWQRAALLIFLVILKGYVNQPFVFFRVGNTQYYCFCVNLVGRFSCQGQSEQIQGISSEQISLSFNWLLTDDGSKVVKPKQQLCQLYCFCFPVFLLGDRYTHPLDIFCLLSYTFYTVIPAFNILVLRQAASLSVARDSCIICWENSSFPGYLLIWKKCLSWGASRSSPATCDR